MPEKIKEILTKIKEWWDKFTTKQKTIIIAISAAVIFVFVLVIYLISRPTYQTLLTCSSTADASEAVEVLQAANINYEVSASGLVISVDTTQISDANLALGSSGILPDDYTLSQALGGGLSTTAADKEKFYKEYKEKKLEQDFAALSAVKSAKVHLNIPTQNGTLSQTKQESSAFIQLELNGTFTSANAANLARATATFLGNSTTANITILDFDSNLLFSGGDDYSVAGVAESLTELQNQAESMVANQVKKVLINTNQFDNVEVTSHLTMDFASYEETVKRYYANDDRTEGMIASERVYDSENSEGTSGVPGTDSNGENLTTYVFQDGAGSESTVSERETQYLPNEDIKNILTPAGGINYSSSSVSITALKYRELNEKDAKNLGLLDGISWDEYKAQNSGDKKVAVDEEFYSIVANATGISEDRITIVAYETPIFYDKEGVQVNWTNVLSIVLLIVILGLLAFVVFTNMQARSQVSEEEELSVENLLQSTPESELEDIDVENKSETRKMIEKFVDDNPEAAAALLRNWLNEDWD